MIPQPSHPLLLISHSPEETQNLARGLGTKLQPGDVLSLEGELGTGKTTFVKGLAEGLGVPDARRSVNSPTFVLMQRYDGRLLLEHFDTYRLEHPGEFADLVGTDPLGSGGVAVVEWGNRVASELPVDRLTIRFAHHNETCRRIEFFAGGVRARQILSDLEPEPESQSR